MWQSMLILKEINIFSWARMKMGKRLKTYISPEYTDTRNQSSKRILKQRGDKNITKIKSARGYSSYINETTSTDDYTKRKVRKGHFQNEDVEDFEANIQEIHNSMPIHGSSKHGESSRIHKEIGYW